MNDMTTPVLGTAPDSWRYRHVLGQFVNEPWALEPGKLATITDLLYFRAAGGKLSAEEIAARVGPRSVAASAPSGEGAGAVAVLSMRGVIDYRIDAFDDISGPGGTALQKFMGYFRTALNDPNVGAILIDVDSPGGSVQGVPETAAEIFAARGTKPIVAIANNLCASAAYWLASSCDELVAVPSGEVGSIGVYMAHMEFSKQLEMLGQKVTLISAGKYKVEANPYEPLSEEAKAHLQSRVEEFYGMFTKGVAKNRGVKVSAVTGGMGQGRVLSATNALAEGMIDKVATFEETLARVAKMAGKKRPAAKADAADVVIVADADAGVIDPVADADQRVENESKPTQRWTGFEFSF